MSFSIRLMVRRRFCMRHTFEFAMAWTAKIVLFLRPSSESGKEPGWSTWELVQGRMQVNGLVIEGAPHITTTRPLICFGDVTSSPLSQTSLRITALAGGEFWQDRGRFASLALGFPSIRKCACCCLVRLVCGEIYNLPDQCILTISLCRSKEHNITRSSMETSAITQHYPSSRLLFATYTPQLMNPLKARHH